MKAKTKTKTLLERVCDFARESCGKEIEWGYCPKGAGIASLYPVEGGVIHVRIKFKTKAGAPSLQIVK